MRQEVRIYTPFVYELNNLRVFSLCIDNQLIYSFSPCRREYSTLNSKVPDYTSAQIHQ